MKIQPQSLGQLPQLGRLVCRACFGYPVLMQRIGLGYDSHRFEPDRQLMLGGLRIEHQRGLAGHSDGDAVLHAITDAVLGAIAAGDIGEIFPDTDPQWRDTDSSLFLKHAMRLAKEKGYAVGNCDVTILAQQPKLAPYKQQIQTRIAELLEAGRDRVSVKAKTNELMGFIGRGEGIAALAVVTLIAGSDSSPRSSKHGR